MPFIPELLNFLSDTFVETGTFQGETLNIIAQSNVSKIISLELSDVFVNSCRKRFENNPNIFIYKGNSKYDLYDKIKDIDSKITFWLDSHWSGTPDVGCDPVTICPVLEELDQIKQHSIKTHTIMIDDIRLMNNSDNKYEGFPVKIDQILTKLYEINPNYQIKYFDDYCAKNDVLVAYIQNVCVHNYLTKCITNPQPPGFADFLRGTIALYIFAKKYNYTLSIDRSHPVFNYLKGAHEYSEYSEYIEELLPPLSYQNIYSILENKFKSRKSFSIMTNSFYNLQNGVVSNYGEITSDCANYMKDLLSPTLKVENKLSYVFNEVYKINMNDRFNIIHLRFGDIFIENNVYNDQMYELYYNKINKLINENKLNEKYVLISDSAEIAKKLKTNIPELLYWDNTKIHLGSLKKSMESGSNFDILDTIVDFFIISKSKEIFSNGSGFSNINSIIYNIKYNLL
jgi:hypothetical protein